MLRKNINLFFDFGHGLFNKSIVNFTFEINKKYINCQSNSSNYGCYIYKFNKPTHMW